MPNKKCTGVTAFVLAAVVMLAAALCGAVYSVNCNAADSENLKVYVNACIEQKQIDISAFFQSCAVRHFKMILCAIFCSLNIYTYGIFVLYYALHGFAFGFSTAFAAKCYSFDSAICLIGSAVISCIFTLPFYMLLFVLSLKYAICRNSTKYIASPKEKRSAFLKFAAICTVMYSILCTASIVEALLNSLLKYL